MAYKKRTLALAFHRILTNIKNDKLSISSVPGLALYGFARKCGFSRPGTERSSGTDTFNSAITRDDDGLITQFGPFSYTRNGPAGAVSAIGDLTLNLTFSYDNYGRLRGKTYTVNSIPVFRSAYSYDLMGRISNTTETW